MVNVTMVGGTAARGGAFGGEGLLQLGFQEVKLKDNFATEEGGAMYCADCARMYMGYPGIVGCMVQCS